MRSLAVVATLAATFHLADPAACTSAAGAKACDFSFHGLYVKSTQVVDVVTPTCDVQPVSHTIDVWLEYKPIDTWNWNSYSRHTISATIPDKTGFPVEVRMTCLAGWFHTRVHVKGRGPADDKNPAGLPFDFWDTGAEKSVTAADCTGGG